MSRTFPAGTTDRVSYSGFPTPTALSVTLWTRGVTATQNARAVRFANGTQIATPATDRSLQFIRIWSTANETTTWSAANHGLSSTRWGHLAIVSGATATSDASLLYGNGTLATSSSRSAPTGTVTSGNSTLAIGNLQDGVTARPWENALAHVAIYNVALTLPEIHHAIDRKSVV